MRASRRGLVIAFVFLSSFCLSSFCLSNLAVAQESDQAAAERVLGPRWKQLSRRAGMVFAGTVLTPARQREARQHEAIDRAVPGAVPAIELSFRVDEAIAGVERGQVLVIHEWVGAWSMQRPVRSGEHILIFFYPPSRLGLTSPVGGTLGQIALDSSGRSVAGKVSVVQLERAIRSAREE